MTRRVARLNSLLREVISEVLARDLHHMSNLRGQIATITNVEITSDLSYAKVYFTLMGTKDEQVAMTKALNTIAPKLQAIALRKVRMRTFPKLGFFYDKGLDHQLHINDLLAKVAPKQEIVSQEDTTLKSVE